MNIYALIIIFTLVISFVLNCLANLLNIKHISHTIPPEFEGVYSPSEYKNSQLYLTHRTRLGLVSSFFDLIVLFSFWFAGGFNFIDKIIRAYSGNEIVSGLFYIGIILGGKFILSLPVRFYSTFVIEERFGFNNTSLSTFFADLVKGLFLGVILGVPLLGGLLWFFQFAGESAWAFAWALTFIFMLILQFVAPSWIMPLLFCPS